jgi:hypothetical protein
MTNVVPPPLAELLAEAAGARLRLARSVPEGFVVTGLIVPSSCARWREKWIGHERP